MMGRQHEGKSMLVRFGAALLLGLTMAGAADAQSFNCRLARTADEVLICQDTRLSDLDEALSTAYSRLRNRLGGAALRHLDADQQHWPARPRPCVRAGTRVAD